MGDEKVLDLDVASQVELSIRKKFHKELFSTFCKAINEYDLIQPNDKIAVCISGGKDSMLMAKLFQELKRHNKFPFELAFLVMDPGYNKINREKIEENARLLNVPITIFETDIFDNVFKNVNGALCVIVDKDYVDNGFFSDGVWLKEPISFSKLFLRSKAFNESKLVGFCNLFMDMLDSDGITIIDNTGRIRAYNVFVESSNKNFNITGGARKRAAYTVINSRRKRIVGIYFQSHEGELFYKPVKK